MAIGTQMLQRRATAAVWNVSDHVLAEGELGVTTDTGVIKIGDGVNAWADLDPAMESQYLPLLGKAADAELLDGVDSTGYVKTADATTAATANKVALRTAAGKLKAVGGTATDEVVNFDQLDLVRKNLIIRSVTATITLALTDVNGTVQIGNSVRTATIAVTIPPNSTVAIPVGSRIDLYSTDIGTVVATAGAGVTLRGDGRVYGNYGMIRLLKTATDVWVVSRRIDPADAYARAFLYMAADTPALSISWRHIPLNAEALDTHGGHVTGAITGDDTDSTAPKQTNRYTCPPGQDGLYAFSGMTNVASPSNARIHARLLKQGAAFAGCTGPGKDMLASTTDQALTGEHLIELTAGQYVGLQGYCSVASWNCSANSGSGNDITSWMSVERIA